VKRLGRSPGSKSNCHDLTFSPFGSRARVPQCPRSLPHPRFCLSELILIYFYLPVPSLLATVFACCSGRRAIDIVMSVLCASVCGTSTAGGQRGGHRSCRRMAGSSCGTTRRPETHARADGATTCRESRTRAVVGSIGSAQSGSCNGPRSRTAVADG
jgi:hypothetical protein